MTTHKIQGSKTFTGLELESALKAGKSLYNTGWHNHDKSDAHIKLIRGEPHFCIGERTDRTVAHIAMTRNAIGDWREREFGETCLVELQKFDGVIEVIHIRR